VSTKKTTRDIAVKGWARPFVKVAPPTVYAGIGIALRQAFTPECEVRAPRGFDELLARLDRVRLD
jgi:hypothetical protein